MAMWGGRFTGEMDEAMRSFNDSFAFDRRLYRADVQGSIAYAGALAQVGLLTTAEQAQIVTGLNQVQAELADGTFEGRPGDEDIHTAVERRLAELLGPVAGKLHTGRSRNDQAATDTRLYLLEQMAALDLAVRELQAAFAKGNAWNGNAMHVDACWDPIRTYPPFVEWLKPKG